MEDEPEMMNDETEPEPSYAYLLDKDKERLCRKDLNYCTWDKKGNPIPFCFQYPKDKKCFYNTNPPNLLFMGCYDDSTCGGKPIGKIKISSKEPPYAYTVDGKCLRSSKLCDWITDEIAVPKCIKEGNVQKCRDATDNLLIGCYTEETCGGNVIPQTYENNNNNSASASEYVAPPTSTKKTTTKKKIKLSTPLLILIIVVPILLTFLSMFSLYVYQNKKEKPLAHLARRRLSFSQQGRRSPKSQKSSISKSLKK